MNKRQNRGITLIALIITIIVMLILVGVTVNVALNGNLFKNAQDASEGTKKARIDEQIQAMIASEMDATTGTVNLNNLAEKLATIEGIDNIDTANNGYITITDKYNRQIRINDDGTLGEKTLEMTIEDANSIFYYTLSNGECSINYMRDNTVEEIEVPSKIGNCPVTKVSICGPVMETACANLISVKLPNTVRELSNYTFRRSY